MVTVMRAEFQWDKRPAAEYRASYTDRMSVLVAIIPRTMVSANVTAYGVFDADAEEPDALAKRQAARQRGVVIT